MIHCRSVFEKPDGRHGLFIDREGSSISAVVIQVMIPLWFKREFRYDYGRIVETNRAALKLWFGWLRGSGWAWSGKKFHAGVVQAWRRAS